MNFHYNKITDLLPNVNPQSLGEKFIQFPLTRLFIVLIFILFVTVVYGIVKASINSNFGETAALYLSYLLILIFIAACLFVYHVYTKSVENRKAYEISFYKFIQELGAGWFLGFGVIVFIVSILALLGYYEIKEFNSYSNLVFMFFDQLHTGFIEELIFRVILFKLTEELFGTWTAMAIQGVLFGFAHSGNPNASIYSTLAIIFAFTIFFGAGYMLTRRLWFIMGFHWSWNFSQAGIFGMENSGVEMPNFIEPAVSGPEWLTGGAWGLELSVLSMVILFSISLYFVKLARERNQFIKPIWQR